MDKSGYRRMMCYTRNTIEASLSIYFTGDVVYEVTSSEEEIQQKIKELERCNESL